MFIFPQYLKIGLDVRPILSLATLEDAGEQCRGRKTLEFENDYMELLCFKPEWAVFRDM